MKQTFIIKMYGNDSYNFERVGCKKVETCLNYIRNWRKQAEERGLHFLYKELFAEDAHYKIISTPDGYNEKEIVCSGLISELFKD